MYIFAFRIVTWTYNYLQKIIFISYSKPDNCTQTNDSGIKETVISNHIIVYKLFVLDWNSWYHRMCAKKLLSLSTKKCD